MYPVGEITLYFQITEWHVCFIDSHFSLISNVFPSCFKRSLLITPSWILRHGLNYKLNLFARSRKTADLNVHIYPHLSRGIAVQIESTCNVRVFFYYYLLVDLTISRCTNKMSGPEATVKYIIYLLF